MRLTLAYSYTEACLACQGFLLLLLIIIQILCFEVATWQGLLTFFAWEDLHCTLATISWTACLAYQALSMPLEIIQYVLVELILRSRRQANPRLNLSDVSWTAFTDGLDTGLG